MYFRNHEPTIEELLDDDVMRLVMARNGLSDEVVRTLVQEVRRRLSARREALPARIAECAA